MITLKYFMRGFPLYDNVFTQYGPSYYLLRAVVYPVIGSSYDRGRLFSLAVWTVIAVLVALYTYRITSSVTLAAIAHLLAFRLLSVITAEPGHPQELCGLILSLALLLPLNSRGWALLGVFAGILLMMKVNVGVLFVISLGLLFPGPLAPSLARDRGVVAHSSHAASSDHGLGAAILVCGDDFDCHSLDYPDLPERPATNSATRRVHRRARVGHNRDRHLRSHSTARHFSERLDLWNCFAEPCIRQQLCDPPCLQRGRHSRRFSGVRSGASDAKIAESDCSLKTGLLYRRHFTGLKRTGDRFFGFRPRRPVDPVCGAIPMAGNDFGRVCVELSFAPSHCSRSCRHIRWPGVKQLSVLS